jgi:PAS domain S-box-containing protein
MRALAQASERIGNLELDRAVDVPARSRELQDLTAAQERMRQALLEATRGLEAKVGARTRELAEREADTRTLLDRQKAIFAASPYGIAVFQNRRFVEASPSFERMFGYEPGEVLGQSTRLLVASEDAFQQLWRGETERREHLLRRKDGSVFWCRITGRAVDPADPDQGSVWMVEDVTQERAAAEALREAKEAADTANRAKSSFLATMSHEIRTPMNGVFGMLELLSLSALDAEQRSTLASAHEAARSLLAIIDDILDVTKIEAGKLEIRPHAASLAATVEESFRVYTGAASAKGLTLRRRIDADLSPAVMIDALRLRQILNNFISNALKFTREGHVEIRAALVGRADGRETVCLSVADTGIGVSPENQKRLFEPFVQAEADTTRRFGGTGLGLTICRRLADLMGGEIEMVSAEGKGTTMRLTLTLDIADPAAIPRPEGATTGAGAPWARRAAPAVAQAERDGTLVLVADDHPLNRTLLVRQVNALGYACEAVDNGLQALEKLKSGRFGALITDCHMPEMDGYDLARAIRRLEAGGTRLPIIACTANALVGEADICRAAGMDDYIAKPVAMSELARALERWRPLPADLAAGGEGEPAGAAPIDRSVLAAVSDGDEGIERDMLLHYRAINASDAADLVGAIAAHDMAQVVRASHRMKGASRMVGAMALADVCEGIERAGRATDWGGVTACRDALSHELSRLDEYLQGL